MVDSDKMRKFIYIENKLSYTTARQNNIKIQTLWITKSNMTTNNIISLSSTSAAKDKKNKHKTYINAQNLLMTGKNWSLLQYAYIIVCLRISLKAKS